VELVLGNRVRALTPASRRRSKRRRSSNCWSPAASRSLVTLYARWKANSGAHPHPPNFLEFYVAFLSGCSIRLAEQTVIVALAHAATYTPPAAGSRLSLAFGVAFPLADEFLS
jgi:hypothetical protein